MANLPFGEYSHERMVAAIRSYYSFLEGLYAGMDNSSTLSYPPPEGWPHITSNHFPYYSTAVVELIRHLPCPSDDESFFVSPDTTLNADGLPRHLSGTYDYSGMTPEERDLHLEAEWIKDVQNSQVDEDDIWPEPDYPPYMLPLASGCQYGSTILIDTKHNTVIRWDYEEDYERGVPREMKAKYPCDVFAHYSKSTIEPHIEYGVENRADAVPRDEPGHKAEKDAEHEPEDNTEDEHDDSDSPDSNSDSDDGSDSDSDSDTFDYDDRLFAWRVSPAFSPEDFFEKCKEQFRIMNWMPTLWHLDHMTHLYTHQEFVGEHLEMRNIMINAGWPGDGEGHGWDSAGATLAMTLMHEDRASYDKWVKDKAFKNQGEDESKGIHRMDLVIRESEERGSQV
ncbi:hypothetical protein VTL71DRAFT_6249 [Oculimacula yallundae]|uniref:Uncharacterized protein n=1 Tax=Oculimacula yallundae TaxID=86028 RepID=A0ABR4C0H3_9HELO